MPDLGLRRKVAERRGYEFRADVTSKFAPQAWALRNGFAIPVPKCDCDLAAAGELLRDIEADGNWWGFTNSKWSDDKPTDPWMMSAEAGPIELDDILSSDDVPDPAERLARAICLLWLAWDGQRRKEDSA